MQRLGIRLGIGLLGLVMGGVLALIVVRVATYDSGDSSTSAGFDYRRCPKFSPGEGTRVGRAGERGQTVPPGSSSALVCRWRGGYGLNPENGEASLRSTAALDSIVSAMNALGPHEEIEGTHSCTVGPYVHYFVVLHYRSQHDVPVDIDYAACPQLNNQAEDTSYQVSQELMASLDASLPRGEPDRTEKRYEER